MLLKPAIKIEVVVLLSPEHPSERLPMYSPLIFAEILPNQISIVAANFVTTTIQVLLAIAGLEFLGFGNSFTVSWGTILYGAYNQGALILGAWWWFVPPGLCIALLGSGLALLNFGIDELADPRLRRERPAKNTNKKAVA